MIRRRHTVEYCCLGFDFKCVADRFLFYIELVISNAAAVLCVCVYVFVSRANVTELSHRVDFPPLIRELKFFTSVGDRTLAQINRFFNAVERRMKCS